MTFNIIILSLFFFIGFLLNSSSAQFIGRNEFYAHCSTRSNFTANSTFDSNLQTLFSSFTSNKTANLDFYNTTVGHGSETIYGLFMCRGDVNQDICRQCVADSTLDIGSVCRFSKEAVDWRHPCLVRYSDRNFFSTVTTMPTLRLLNPANFSNQAGFMNVLTFIMNQSADEASKSAEMKKFKTNAVAVQFQTLYVLVQCTPDLSSADCRRCLSGVIGHFRWCCDGKIGGKVLYPSCLAHYELYPFFNSSTPLLPVTLPPPPALLSPPNPVVVASVGVLGIFIRLACYLLNSLIKKRRNAVLRQKYFGNESNNLEPLQFSLVTIEAATNNFSDEKCLLGRGGFGRVYKGILSNGQEIAVKRLSKCSGQGAEEFKNEILLIAKLQHRNLVALLGYCIEEQEKILIYEYVPNRSLDYFLFGSTEGKVLSWMERCKIIGGVARGILYLHDYSRLKIIHRDLKPSNILLDDEMNPKISDFGLAKMVAINSQEGSTNRIVGTYSYMSPEYAMYGQYSEKSDVFSFGVIILEITTRKKNTSRQNESQYVDGLLSYAWKQWKEEKLLEILDLNIKEFASYNEVIRCIHIGLLCVQENPDSRPTMATVVSYLSNDSIQLPLPREPAFFLHDGMKPNTSGSKESGSIVEVSMSEFYPR
ncbi:putative receptor-like protein kinase At4g00960 [Neltuma alba]|uniref:putative receptor-like protein kinase At4g00960 n=1 Tax=Neltuma alba TaxID=207710 RepID=UPI0010A46983|nr:putative receptor-like protein kinase At4g00960 [Prosopis alba]